MSDDPRAVHLDIESATEQVDQVQVVAEDFARAAGLDGDALEWIVLAVREAVVNAIVHGNACDPGKRVFVDFSIGREAGSAELWISIRDQGAGFVPSDVADPLAPENLLKAHGRGVFLMSQLADGLSVRPAAGGGTEVRLMKRIPR